MSLTNFKKFWILFLHIFFCSFLSYPLRTPILHIRPLFTPLWVTAGRGQVGRRRGEEGCWMNFSPSASPDNLVRVTKGSPQPECSSWGLLPWQPPSDPITLWICLRNFSDHHDPVWPDLTPGSCRPSHRTLCLLAHECPAPRTGSIHLPRNNID